VAGAFTLRARPEPRYDVDDGHSYGGKPETLNPGTYGPYTLHPTPNRTVHSKP